MAGPIDLRSLKATPLLVRGRASIKDIIRANYGEWPLRGLDIVTDEHLDVQVAIKSKIHLHFKVIADMMSKRISILKGLREMRLVRKAGGYASATADRTIYLGYLKIMRMFVWNGHQM